MAFILRAHVPGLLTWGALVLLAGCLQLETPHTFREDEEIKAYLNQEDIEGIFNLDYHLKHVDEIFERVFT